MIAAMKPTSAPTSKGGITEIYSPEARNFIFSGRPRPPKLIIARPTQPSPPSWDPRPPPRPPPHPAPPPQRPQAFLKHHRADQAQKQHIGQLHEQIDLTQMRHPCENPAPKRRSRKAPQHQHDPHAEIDGLPLELRQNTRNRRGNNLICAGGNRDGGRDSDEEQQRRDQETAAHTKHAG